VGALRLLSGSWPMTELGHDTRPFLWHSRRTRLTAAGGGGSVLVWDEHGVWPDERVSEWRKAGCSVHGRLLSFSQGVAWLGTPGDGAKAAVKPHKPSRTFLPLWPSSSPANLAPCCSYQWPWRPQSRVGACTPLEQRRISTGAAVANDTVVATGRGSLVLHSSLFIDAAQRRSVSHQRPHPPLALHFAPRENSPTAADEVSDRNM
jgi:hypothetical protein